MLCVIHNDTPYYPCYDGNGNITHYVDTNAMVVARGEYDPYGCTVLCPGTHTNTFRFWFSTKVEEPSSHLYYYGYRWYSPAFGR